MDISKQDFVRLTTQGYPIELEHSLEDFYAMFADFVNQTKENNFLRVRYFVLDVQLAVFEVFREEQIKDKQSRVKEQTTGLEELWKEISDTEQSLNDIAEHQSQINDIQLEINKNLQSVSALQKYIEKIKTELSELSEIGKIDEENEQLEVYRDKLARLESLLKDEYKTKEIHNVATLTYRRLFGNSKNRTMVWLE